MGDLSVKWWSEKPWLAESMQTLSLPVVVPGPGSSLICLRTWKDGDGGVWRRVIPEGVCHIVWRWHLRRPTGLHSGQPVSPAVFPLREQGLHGFSQSHQSLCMSSSRSLLHCTQLDLLDSQLTELAYLKTLFVQFLLPEVDSLFCFCGEIFPHHTTVPFPNHESAGQRRHQCHWLCLWN